MLKCQRVILGPSRPSRYGKLRREPRRDGLSTLEAAAMLLAGLEKRPDIAETLHASFERMLTKYREVQIAEPALAPKPRPKRDYRRRRRN
jgi:DTW domain-containing protein YfiP